MSDDDRTIKRVAPFSGNVRSSEKLNVLQSEIQVISTCPLKGLIIITTDDGALQLMISGNAAADFLIDLKQFLSHDV